MCSRIGLAAMETEKGGVMKNRVGSEALSIEAVAKVIVCVVLVVVVAYSVIAEVSIDGDLLNVVLLVLAVHFGLSAKVLRSELRDRRRGGGDG